MSTRVRRMALAAVPLLTVAGLMLAGDGRSAAGIAVGTGLVVLFFVGGRAPQALPEWTQPSLLFAFIAMGYMLRIILLIAALSRLAGATWLSRTAVGGTLIVATLAWSAILVWSHLTSNQPTLEIQTAPSRTAL